MDTKEKIVYEAPSVEEIEIQLTVNLVSSVVGETPDPFEED